MAAINAKKKLLNMNKVSCPDCSHQLPFFRIPKSLEQFMWGGWACPKCGCKIGRFGEPLERDRAI